MSKKIYRIKEEAVVAGVIAGLARYFKQDPVLFRIAAITFLILTGFSREYSSTWRLGLLFHDNLGTLTTR